jgi:hypothetical protein
MSTTVDIAAWLALPPREIHPSPDELVLDEAALARGLGYGPATGRTMPEHIAEAAHRLIPLARTLVEPRAIWAPTSARFDDGKDVLVCEAPRPGRLTIGGIVRGQLVRSEAVAIFAATIGNRLELLAREWLRGGEPLDGYVLDALGSIAVESVGDKLEAAILADLAPLGWKITNRYSPGYCTWPTADQQQLFALLPERPAGIHLTDSSLMTPIKSISGVIGLGAKVEHRPYTCDLCGMESCPQRLVEARF